MFENVNRSDNNVSLNSIFGYDPKSDICIYNVFIIIKLNFHKKLYCYFSELYSVIHNNMSLNRYNRYNFTPFFFHLIV